MVSLWQIYSFDRSKWDAVFGGGLPGAEQKVIDAMLWENEGYFDGEADDLQPGPYREEVLASQEGREARALASHLTRNGFTYSGLDANQSEALDRFACTMWTPEGIPAELDARLHGSPAGGEVSELITRAGHARSAPLQGLRRLVGRRPNTPVCYLHLLETGRRYGNPAEPTKAEGYYCVIFAPAEVMLLRDEVETAINAPIPWRCPRHYPECAERGFLAPLEDVIRSGRRMAMTLCL